MPKILNRIAVKPSIFITVLVILCVLFCSKRIPVVELVKTKFSLTFPDNDSKNSFARVRDIDVDNRGNFYILDTGKRHVFKFDSSGKFIKSIITPATSQAQIDRPCSINVFDNLLVLHNIYSLQFFDLDGKYKKSFALTGRGDICISPNGTIIVNRMSDSHQFGHCIETYNADWKRLAAFRAPRAKIYKNELADFAFSGVTSGNQIVYVPALLDSIFLYDLTGNLLRSGRLVNTIHKNKNDADSLVFETEDIFIDGDNVYILRSDAQKSSAEIVYVKNIDQYDLELNLIQTFELPESITMTIASDLDFWAPWYHRFLVKNNQFIFMVSQPKEHLLVFEPEKRITH